VHFEHRRSSENLDPESFVPVKVKEKATCDHNRALLISQRMYALAITAAADRGRTLLSYVPQVIVVLKR
jgi:hypothetical protein